MNSWLPVQIVAAEEVKMLEPVLLQAFEAIGAKSGRYDAADVLARIVDHELQDLGTYALIVVVDATTMGNNVCAAVGGVVTLLASHDELGRPVAFVTRLWVRPGIGRKADAFRATWPLIDEWARRRGCRRVLAYTERGIETGDKPERLSLGEWGRRLRGLWAYTRWLGRYGFALRGAMFEKELTN